MTRGERERKESDLEKTRGFIGSILGSAAREMAEMGRKSAGKSGEKSNFAVTCSLLSQYIKEKGSIADLGLGMAPHPQETAKG